jgi:hypothetical protein
MARLGVNVQAFAICAALALVARGSAAEFHVTPTGTSVGTGSLTSPWDLRTALNQPAIVKPGDTIWLHGGRYRGRFTSNLTGTATAPIILRQVANERATIDGGVDPSSATILRIDGNYSWYWGFEITSSDPKRQTTQTGSWPTDITRGGGIDTGNSENSGVGVKLINLVVHDTAQGLSLWRFAKDLEAYGNICYFNGWDAPDRGHGHGIYTQNELGTKRIEDGIVFANFSYGMQAYGSATAYVDNYRVSGNTHFQTATISSGDGGNLLVGGGRPSRNIVVENNYTYGKGNGVNVGYTWVNGQNENAVVRGNYCAGAIRIVNYKQLTFRDNTVVAPSGLAEYDVTQMTTIPVPLDWNNNSYFCQELEWQPFGYYTPTQNFGLYFPEWKQRTGYDSTSTYTKALPSAVKTFVRPNRYEPGRANITVFNWPKQTSVNVDVSPVLQPGDIYEVRDSQNFFGAAVATGTYMALRSACR